MRPAWGKLQSERGSAVSSVVIAAAMLVFVVLPVYSFVMEKYILMEKARVIRDAVDITNISAYNALDTQDLGRVRIDVSREKAMALFQELLAQNLRLEDDLKPDDGSVAEGQVSVLSLEIYQNGFPAVCPEGVTLLRPSVHSSIRVPIRPSLYRSVILGLLGREYIDVVVHVDSEIPLNH